MSRPSRGQRETVDDPTPGPGEVVVEVAACGMCGTDLHILQGEFAPTLPIVPGPRVRRHGRRRRARRHRRCGGRPGRGRPVAVLLRVPLLPARPEQPVRALERDRCHACRAARPSTRRRRSPTASRCPTHVRLEDAALIEPLSCAVRGYDVLRSQLGPHVLIYGSGHDGADDARAGQARRRGLRRHRRPQRRPAGDRPRARGHATAAVGRRVRAGRAAGTWSSTPPGTPRRSRTASAGSARAAPSCSSGSPTTRPAPRSSRTGSTTRRSPSPVRWRCCTATSGQRSCSPTG